MQFASIAIPTPVRTAFTYAIPSGMTLSPGMRVAVEFRKRRAMGIVIDLLNEPPLALKDKKIKTIDSAPDESPLLSPSLVKLIRWMAEYYCAPIGEVVKAALPARLLNARSPKTTRPSKPHEITPLKEKIFSLNKDQERALNGILDCAKSEKPKVSLLHGITGSGKTEVYLRLFAELIKEGKQGLLLVPEIGLTPQLAGRAAARFGNRVTVYHSGLTDAQRHAQWLRMRNGDIDLVIGTRSALFAPLPNLGAIVVDEEHDSSFKQDEGFSYHGRDSAVMRAHIEGIAVVLGSATPSLESIANVRSGKYIYHSLPMRTAGALLPSIEIVDMRLVHKREKNSSQSEGENKKQELCALSPKLFDAISETLARGEQTLLFIGRRGFANSVHCEACGEVVSCPNCDISLTVHSARTKNVATLFCHYCDYKILIPDECPLCGASEFTSVGHGTQRLEAELMDFFPKARIARLDSDVASSQRARRKILSNMRERDTDILIGTQMITKGHDFADVTLVGIVSADVSLYLPDFRAAERTFQLLTQVAGRAGRAARRGRVIIQTYQPENPALMSASKYDFDGFTAGELSNRKKLSYPPFGRIAMLRVSSNTNETASKAARTVCEMARKIITACSAISILGPAPAPIAKLRNRFRWQILIKAQNAASLGRLLGSMRRGLETKLPRNVRLAIDVDPVNLM